MLTGRDLDPRRGCGGKRFADQAGVCRRRRGPKRQVLAGDDPHACSAACTALSRLISITASFAARPERDGRPFFIPVAIFVRSLHLKILFINAGGGGFASTIDVPEAARSALSIWSRSAAIPEGYLIRVNRMPTTIHQILQEGDRVSVTPLIEGAIAN